MKILVTGEQQRTSFIEQGLVDSGQHSVFCCQTDEEALNKTREWQPDFVICELALPERDAFALCLAFKSDPKLKHLPLLIYTDRPTEPDDKQLALAMGAVRFILITDENEILLKDICRAISLASNTKPQNATPEQLLGFSRQHTKILSRQLQEKNSHLDMERRALRESHYLNNTILSTTADAILAIDEDNRIRFANNAACTLFGHSVPRLTQMSITELMPARFRDTHRTAFAKYLKSGERILDNWQAIPLTALHKSGKEIPVEVSFGEQTSDNKRMFIGTIRDISERRANEEALELSAKILATTTDLVAVVDKDYTYRMVNDAYLKTFRREREAIVGKTVSELMGEENFESIARHYYDVCFLGEAVHYRSWFNFNSGHRHFMEVFYYPHCNDQGEVQGAIVSSRDITEQKLAEDTLRIMDRAAESSNNGIVITDSTQPDKPIIYLNPAFEKMTGYSLIEIERANPRLLYNDDLDQPGLHAIRRALRNREACNAIVRSYRKNGEQYWADTHVAPVFDDEGELTHYVGISSDVTEQVQYEQELRFQATHDLLTGIPNRSLLYDRLEQSISSLQRDGGKLALLFIDIDRFKQINDSLGHGLGDELLIQIVDRINGRLRKSDTLARLSGDEFVILLRNVNDESSVEAIATEIHRAIAQPYKLQGHDVITTCSIGISLYPGDADNAESLLRNADIAMYSAKESGRDSIRIYSPGMSSAISERMKLETSLRRALERDELELYFQPQVDLASSKMIGAEALLRWHCKEHGLVSPSQFIPIAEETGLIIPIGEWVLNEACKKMKHWIDQGYQLGKISINVSGIQITRGNIAKTVDQALQRHRLSPSSIELEVTESSLMHQIEIAIQIMEKLNKLGVSLAIDDFGTGYSSLSYLKKLPIHKLKIDRSFVSGIPHDPDDATIAKSIIALAKSLQKKVIAEGIETDEQRQFMINEGCHEGQGYLLSYPMNSSDFEAYLKMESSNIAAI